jgi:tRNA(adenine34) deaminase
MFLDNNKKINNDKKWMKLAIRQALIAQSNGEVPVGAVLVKDEKLIAKSHNQSITKNDASAHAEIQVIRLAGDKLNNYRLNNSTIYVTLEPCSMCFGAIVHARINRLVFGAFDARSGVCGSCEDFSKLNCFNHKITIQGGVNEIDCKTLIQSFFKLRR